MSLQNGYSTLTVQSEVTDDGPFDKREMDDRKAMAMSGRNKNDSYPHVDPANLCVLPGEVLLTRKCHRAHKRSTGAKIAVFSSLNGYWHGRYRSQKALCKRNLQFVGISKTLYQLPGVELTGSARGNDYQTDSGIAWLSSGAISANRNTGPLVIMAGDLVYLELPDTALMYSQPGGRMPISPNNAVPGAPVTKYVPMTLPVSQMDFGTQIEYYYSMFSRSSSDPNGGCVDVPFQDLYKRSPSRPNEKALEDGPQAAAALWFAIWGIKTALDDAVPALPDFRTPSATARKDAIKALERLFINHGLSATKRMQTLRNLQATNAGAFVDNSLRLKSPEEQNDATKLHIQFDALSNLFSAIADALAEQNRWIIGRALHTSHPGDTLDLDIGSFTTPYTF